MSIEDILKSIHEGATVKVVNSPRELLEEVQRDEAIDRVKSMTSERALELSTAAMLGCGDEFAKGHLNCADFKLQAAQTWHAIAESLERREQMADSIKRREEMQASQDRLYAMAEEENISPEEAYARIEKQERDARLGRTADSGSAPE